jgi:hypothetical protein
MIFGDFGACHKKRLTCNFDPTSRGRNEVQKLKGHHIIRQNLMESPKKITVLCLENFIFDQIPFLKKTTLKKTNSLPYTRIKKNAQVNAF